MNGDLAARLLGRTDLFRGVPAADLARLAAAAAPRAYAAGQTLFEEGAPAAAFHCIVAGQVRLFRWTPDGDEKIYQVLGAGKLLAESAVFADPAVYPMTAAACAATETLRLERTGLTALCRRSPDFALHLLASMSNRIVSAMNRIDQLTLSNALQRLVAYLVELHRHQRSLWLELPLGHGDIAKQLAVTPETLSRLLARLRKAGLVSTRRRTLVLLDLDGLCHYAGLPSPGAAPSGARPDGGMVGCCSLA
ncbi:MAG: Crp/Fnr family transcriptional regulator [Hyphomicrobiales bacterium]|nr:Crp/Fnr family transcriptional regulator [Hyphomicrobiales bacterium]MCP5370247.1 Crp/Fnr family transcriptional regulator [Hyphomicrobiales bacterium]